MTEEKRHFNRFFHDAKTQLDVNGECFEGQLLDISLKGCLIDLPDNWPDTGPEQTVNITVLLAETITISGQATLSHIHPGHRAGFTFDSMDLDSITNLRRLVELNLGDSQILERELNALVGA